MTYLGRYHRMLAKVRRGSRIEIARSNSFPQRRRRCLTWGLTAVAAAREQRGEEQGREIHSSGALKFRESVSRGVSVIRLTLHRES